MDERALYLVLVGEPVATAFELFDLIVEHSDKMRAWNAEMREFLAQEPKPATISIRF